jgi:hypothetical protein
MAKMKHIVLLKFKADVTSAQIEKVFKDLAGLQDKIEGILDFMGGPYSSGEGLNQGYTHGFIMTFTDAAARDAYLPHPDHEVVKQSILPLVDGVCAFDFETA